MINKYQPDIST